MGQAVQQAASPAVAQTLGQLLAVGQGHFSTALGSQHAGEAHAGTHLKPQPGHGEGRVDGAPAAPDRVGAGREGGKRVPSVPPALACRAGFSGGPRGTGPGPRRRATRTSRTASSAPEKHRVRRWGGGGGGSRFYRPASPPPPPGGTSGMRSVSAAGPSVKRYRRTPPRRRPRLGSPMAAPPPNGGRPRVVPGRADQSAPSPVVASGGAPPRALMAAGRLLRAGPVPALRAASPECRR